MCIIHHTHCSVESVVERGAGDPSLSSVCGRGSSNCPNLNSACCPGHRGSGVVHDGLTHTATKPRKRLCSTCLDESSSPPPPPQEKNPQPTQKRLPIKTSPHQCDTPGIDPMIRPHLRINCTDPSEDSCPGRITVRVLALSRTRLSKFSCH